MRHSQSLRFLTLVTHVLLLPSRTGSSSPFRLDFCNGLLYGFPKSQIAKLQRVQNAAARLAVNISKYSHVTEALQDLHWLPVRARIVSFKDINLRARSFGINPE